MSVRVNIDLAALSLYVMTSTKYSPVKPDLTQSINFYHMTAILSLSPFFMYFATCRSELRTVWLLTMPPALLHTTLAMGFFPCFFFYKACKVSCG